MQQPAETNARPASRRRRRLVTVVVAVVIILGALLALIFVPYNSSAQEIQLSPGSGTSTSLTIPEAGWVTIHFDHPYRMGMSMHYWIQGSGGTMMDHSTVVGSDSYSFWSWGGTYRCGAGLEGSGYGTVPVWVNATWGML